MGCNNIKFTITSILLVASFFVDLTQSCDGLRNVFMTIKDTTDRLSNTTVNGCIQRTVFDGKTATEIHVKNQNIPNLGKDYVKHLVKLDILEFKHCGIETIARGAFRNLPVIRIVGITHNPKLTLITGGIFDIFDTIHILRLNNNNIDTITDEALSNMTLQEVNFSYNNFSKFDPVWFAYSPYIKHLYFQNNRIQKIPKRAFDTFQQLQNINFDNNRITEIGTQAFRKLKNLRTLSLRNNHLSNINPNVFPTQLRIDSLNLAGNFLYNIPNDVLKHLSLKEIIIDYNHFVCSCFTDLTQYFKAYNVSVKKSDNCNLNFLPFCISTGDICREFEANTEEIKNLIELTQKFKDFHKKLSAIDKKCANLEHYDK